MTREQLEKSLEKIGWRIVKSNNELNDYIINDENEETDFVAYEDYLQIRSDSFGKKSFKGDFYFHFSGITIKEGNNVDGTFKGENPSDDNKNKVDYVSLSFSKKCFIQFYKKRN